MVRPVIHPRGRIPAESIVLDDWRSGMSRNEMALAYGVNVASIGDYIRPRLKRWERESPRVSPAPGKVVTYREVWLNCTLRRLPISLPANSMWMKAREDHR